MQKAEEYHGFGLGSAFGLNVEAFLKLMGAGVATTAAAKSGLLGLLKSGKTSC